MKNTFGNAITVTLFGESHGPAIGAVIDGLAPGIKIDREYIDAKLEQRKAKGKYGAACYCPQDPNRIVPIFFHGTPLYLHFKADLLLGHIFFL